MTLTIENEAAQSGRVVQIGRVRYRFVFRRQESILRRASSGVEGFLVTADPQKGEGLLWGEFGVEWRPAYNAAGGAGFVESILVPWSAVLEIRGERVVVLEYRELYEGDEDRLRVVELEEADRESEDWSPLRGEAFDSIRSSVLDLLSEPAQEATDVPE